MVRHPVFELGHPVKIGLANPVPKNLFQRLRIFGRPNLETNSKHRRCDICVESITQTISSPVGCDIFGTLFLA